ncbi:MAG: virulence RhuM family protein [Lentimicrobiaceae bacterium]|nr:virulence RhuM family protein [Lentimicrobiaceae bacterium]
MFNSGELDENSVVRKFRTTASDGKEYNQKYYNLQAIIAVGFKVNSDKASRFRAWAADVLADFAIKGYILDGKDTNF